MGKYPFRLENLKMRLSEDFWRFVKEHQYDDVYRLRLKYGGHNEEIDMAIEQIEARKKVGRKLPLFLQHERLLFPSALSAEQCSSEDTADYKRQLVAGRFHSICDLTGGLGIDAYYMAMVADKLTYIERFEQYCDVARYNFETLEQKNIDVINADCREYLAKPHSTHELYFIDPARRGTGNKRVFHLCDCEPSVADILPQVWAEGASLLLKASPMLNVKQAIDELGQVFEVHVVSVRNECKELLLLLSPEAKDAPRIYCTNKTSEGWQTYTFLLKDEELLPSSPAALLQKYLYEPNSAIMKAGAFKSVAHSFGIDKLAVSSHLYTSDCLIADFPGRTFEILEALPFSNSLFKEAVGKYPQANVAVRNFPLSAEELCRKGRIKDGGDIYLFATTVGSEKMLIYSRKVSV